MQARRTVHYLSVIFLLVAAAIAQDSRPKLELEPRLNLNGGGFQTVSGSMTGGTGMEGTHFLWHVYGTYNAAKKVEYTDLQDNTNPHGNIRSIGGRLGLRSTNGWILVASGSYAQLRTTNYVKNDWGVSTGAGHDWMRATCPNCSGKPTSIRMTIEYSLPVHSGRDIEHGFLTNVYVPSLVETNRHIFFHVFSFAGWVNGQHDATTAFGILGRF